MTFPLRLKKSREEAELTQQGLADLIGVTRSCVNLWENPPHAESMPNPGNLKRVSEILKVSPRWLRFGDDINFQPKDYKIKVAESSNAPIIQPEPILSFTEIGGWLKAKGTILKKGTEMSTEEIQTVCFKLPIEGDAMLNPNDYRSILPGEIGTFDPSCVDHIKPGDVVLAKFGNTDNYKIRIFDKDGTDLNLISLNPSFPPVEVNDNVMILAKLIKTERIR